MWLLNRNYSCDYGEIEQEERQRSKVKRARRRTKAQSEENWRRKTDCQANKLDECKRKNEKILSWCG